MYSAVNNIQYFLSHDDWQDFPLEAVNGGAAYYWLGKAVPKSDGVREEGFLVETGFWHKVQGSWVHGLE